MDQEKGIEELQSTTSTIQQVPNVQERSTKLRVPINASDDNASPVSTTNKSFKDGTDTPTSPTTFGSKPDASSSGSSMDLKKKLALYTNKSKYMVPGKTISIDDNINTQKPASILKVPPTFKLMPAPTGKRNDTDESERTKVTSGPWQGQTYPVSAPPTITQFLFGTQPVQTNIAKSALEWSLSEYERSAVKRDIAKHLGKDKQLKDDPSYCQNIAKELEERAYSDTRTSSNGSRALYMKKIAVAIADVEARLDQR